VKVKIWQEGALPVIKAADLLLVASGTATLEAAYFQTPMIIIYRVSALTFLLAKLLVKVSWIGLVNLIAAEEVVPEFIQRKARPQEIAEVAIKYLKDKEEIERIKRRLSGVMEKLQRGNTSFKVAQIALDLCKEE
jgi:lipid-A-disaccharide synthase